MTDDDDDDDEYTFDQDLYAATSKPVDPDTLNSYLLSPLTADQLLLRRWEEAVRKGIIDDNAARQRILDEPPLRQVGADQPKLKRYNLNSSYSGPTSHLSPETLNLIRGIPGNKQPATLRNPPEMVAYCPECDTSTRYQETPPHRCPTCLALLTSRNPETDRTDDPLGINGKPGKPTKPVFDHHAVDVQALMFDRSHQGVSRDGVDGYELVADPTVALLGEDEAAPRYGWFDDPHPKDAVAKLLDVPEPPRIGSGPTNVFMVNEDGSHTLLGTATVAPDLVFSDFKIIDDVPGTIHQDRWSIPTSVDMTKAIQDMFDLAAQKDDDDAV